MNYWWVNQNKTFKIALNGGYLWSPKQRSDGGRSEFYDNMTKVQPGDIVFSFVDTYIQALAVVVEPHKSRDKPAEFKTADPNWTEKGWYVKVDYTLLENKVRPRDRMDLLAPLLPDKYSPLQPNGDANQVYLAHISPSLAKALLSLIGEEGEEKLAEAAAAMICQDKNLTVTEKEQLIKARRGQGLFRRRVSATEVRCRVTGIDDERFLTASHIRPWSKSDNEARLDGNNGLMLSPHIDRLFDKGYISFDDLGDLLISTQLPAEIKSKWDLGKVAVRKPLSEQQRLFMAYHRSEILRK